MITPSVLWLFAKVALVVLACSTLQSLAGFGFALFAVPSLLFLGLKLPEAVSIALAATLVQGIATAIPLRRQVQWRAIVPPSALFLLATPLGVALMGVLVALGPERTKQGVGIIMLLALALWWLGRVEPREHVAPVWGWAAGAAGGILAGSVGMGGPPFVLWVLAHRWSSEQMRGSLLTIYAVATPLQAVLLWQVFGVNAVRGLVFGVCCSPLVVLGTRVGMAIAGRLPVEALRRLMLGLLVALALSALAAPWLARLIAAR